MDIHMCTWMHLQYCLAHVRRSDHSICVPVRWPSMESLEGIQYYAHGSVRALPS